MAPQSRPPILVTRPQPQAARFARQLRGLDWTGRVFVSPVLEPVLLAPRLPALTFSGVILTSETAVHGALHLPDLPRLAYCVGDRTAEAARRAGFDATSAKGNQSDLLAVIRASRPLGPLLYLHGRETRGSLAQDLRSAGIETHSALVYEQNPRPLTQAARRLIQQPGPVMLPLFSPRSAALLVEAWATIQTTAAPQVIALSRAVAEAAAPLRPARLAVAERPDGESLLAAMGHMAVEAGWA